jgi:hypothetical protein
MIKTGGLMDNLEEEKIIETEDNEKIYLEEIEEEEKISGFVINNLFKEDDTTEYRSVRDLHKNPPVLTLIEDENNSMSLNLDLETVKVLIDDLKVIEKGFYGYKYDRLSIKDKIKNLPKDIKYHPLPYIWFGIILFLILVLSFFFS